MQDVPLSLEMICERINTVNQNKRIIERSANADRDISFLELSTIIENIKKALSKVQVESKEIVATIGRNTIDHTALSLAVPAMHHIFNPINPDLGEDQLRHIVKDSSANILLIADSELKTAQQLTSLGWKQQELDIPNFEFNLFIKETAEKEKAGVLTTPETVFETPETAFDETHAATLIYTSGTTGMPKGVLSSHRSIMLHTLSVCLPDVMNISQNSTVYPLVPIYHVNAWGMIYAAAMQGANIVLGGGDLSKENLKRTLLNDEVTHIGAVPTVLTRVLDTLEEENTKLKNLQMIVSGGAPLTETIITRFYEHHGCQLMQGWGGTETGPNVSSSQPKDNSAYEEKIETTLTAGRLNPLMRAKIVDDSGQDLPWDNESIGELMLRGPHVATGYWNGEKEFEDWFATGDLGSISADGYVTIKSRKKDLIKSGGEWILPVEVEELVREHGNVLEACVFGVPDPKWDELPIAAVILKDTGLDRPDYEELQRINEQRTTGKLPKWWIPKALHFRASFPLNANGKIDKEALKQQFISSIKQISINNQ